MLRAFLVFVALVLVPRSTWPQGGTPLGPEFRVNSYTTIEQESPSVASDSSGNFVVVWRSHTQDDGSFFGVFGQRYSGSGIPLGPEFRVNTYTTSDQAFPSVAADTTGNFAVVWMSFGQDGDGGGVFGQRYASSGIPLGPEFRVNSYTTFQQHSSAVASDSSGNFVVVWTSQVQDGASDGVFGQRYAGTGPPLAGEFRVNTYTTGDQFLPILASDASGNFVVVWTSFGQDGSSSGIFGQRYASSGISLGSEFRINTYTTSFQGNPAAASDAFGNFVVVWSSYTQDGSGDGVFGQRYAISGLPLGPEFRVNTFTTGPQFWPSVAADAAGNFVIAWTSLQDGNGFGVFGQRYAGSGAPLGPEFRVNTYTTSYQENPAVASDSSGDFVVVWQSHTQDGSSTGVFGQRYGEIVPVELMLYSVE